MGELGRQDQLHCAAQRTLLLGRGSACVIAALVLVGFTAKPACATETVDYTYDAQGRLVHTVHSGSANSGVEANYEFDDADNRVSAVVTGAPSQVIVVPINRYAVIPIVDPQ